MIAEEGVAVVNGAIVAYAERQIYARDANFFYPTHPNAPPRKANKLLGDKIFRRPRKADATTEAKPGSDDSGGTA
jgi:hypothetical protein